MRFFETWFRALITGARDPDARPLYFAAGGLLLIGTIFYSVVEGWRPLDSLYFSVVTLTTVGLGDFTPQTDLGKVFTIFYVLAGISVILAFANAVLQGAAARERERLERRASRGTPPEREA
jgi:voltage-gated potassium channel